MSNGEEKIFGIQYEDGSWLRWDGYATMPGQVARAWCGTRTRAQRLIALGVPIGPCTVKKLPIAKSEPRA